MSVAVAVGFIALADVAAETGVVMLIYLEHAYAEVQERRAMEGQPFTHEDLYSAIMSGAVERVRPKMMSTVTGTTTCRRALARSKYSNWPLQVT